MSFGVRVVSEVKELTLSMGNFVIFEFLIEIFDARFSGGSLVINDNVVVVC